MIPQIQSGVVQSVTPSQTSGLYISNSAGQEKVPAAVVDFEKALNDTGSQFAATLESQAYNGQNCFGVYDKDEGLNGSGLTP